MQDPHADAKYKTKKFIVPLLLLSSFLGISISWDFSELNTDNQRFWVQRVGSLITIYAAYISFYEFRFVQRQSTLVIHNNEAYKKMALLSLALGTIIWGYGDLPFR